jgi:hypothetical protein
VSIKDWEVQKSLFRVKLSSLKKIVGEGEEKGERREVQLKLIASI